MYFSEVNRTHFQISVSVHYCLSLLGFHLLERRTVLYSQRAGVTRPAPGMSPELTTHPIVGPRAHLAILLKYILVIF